jgi:VanZ family protein
LSNLDQNELQEKSSKQMIARIGNWICVLAKWVFWPLVGLVVALSLWPVKAHPPSVPWSDKVQHAQAYFVLGLTFLTGWFGAPVPFLRNAMLALLGMGAVLELLQGLPMIGRTTSVLDLLADAAGLVLAVGSVWLFAQLCCKK